jgi:hypothetical protein
MCQIWGEGSPPYYEFLNQGSESVYQVYPGNMKIRIRNSPLENFPTLFFPTAI